MPVFQYKGFDSKGKAVHGGKDADNARVVRQMLRREGILVSELKESAVGGSRGPTRPGERSKSSDSLLQVIASAASPAQILAWLNQRGDADPQVIAVLTRQLATLLRAGV